MRKTLRKFVKLRKLIHSDIIINKYKIGSKSFTRKGKMSFQDLILFMMNMVNKTLQREINDYRYQLHKGTKVDTNLKYGLNNSF